jgi:hypothetical protein
VALSPAQIDALATYTNAEMAKLLRYAIVQLASDPTNQTVEVAGRKWSTHQLPEMRRLERDYRDAAAADAAAAEVVSATGGAGRIRFVDAG